MNIIIFVMVVTSYLWGSVSSAILVCKLSHLPNPLINGSCNPGATNVLRLGGKLEAVFVMIFDIFKGILPVWSGFNLGLSSFCLILVAISAYLGHIYPIFFNFNGGKGVAITLGIMLPIDYYLSGLMIGIWLLMILLFGYSSLSAIICALVIPFYVIFFKPQFTYLGVILSLFILLRHHENIKRLLHGREKKIWDFINIKDKKNIK
ncbi:glycerol-3-phosphate 1-O-acyltransferase PlsY [Candidatus Curculioniphilus buchneri]|uniref:glycerol-3-phosphate 1-O-acyltransferase PlsY n=1 Tax=Candidatus Curculioniphilus buchneri TaxID=690594 RepID=UPI00376F0A27